ncbi:CLCA_X family protein [Lacimicrobium sp. SS2-24]|uniref:CLCA_X family protein n=1 Tax=Lacimicrobium sp. SS2-24 TaxID=2005569 RepID=UPI000B4C0260|nr:CLCA_X family protein [Lacimicrobium sp. SS2-24]
MTQTRLHRPYFRNGPNHRDGEDVSFADINRVFGFRAVTIGKWVTRSEQQLAANLFFDAFCDLMLILSVPETVISLNGQLSLSFGSGGNKYASAHYDARTRTLALAKNAGGGALAHEWFHAFDHYICPRVFEQVGRTDFASASWLEKTPLLDHPLNQRLAKWFKLLFLTDDGEHGNAYLQQAVSIDKQMNSFYFAQPQELAARAFEAIVQHQQLKNAFLVQGTKQSQEALMGLYPEDAHLLTLQSILFEYFYLLGRALDGRS